MWYNRHHHNVRHHKDNQYVHHVNPHDPTGRYDPSLAVRQLLETGQYNLLASLATGWTIIIIIIIIWMFSYIHHEIYNIETKITLLQCEGWSKKLAEVWRFTYNRFSSSSSTLTITNIIIGVWQLMISMILSGFRSQCWPSWILLPGSLSYRQVSSILMLLLMMDEDKGFPPTWQNYHPHV